MAWKSDWQDAMRSLYDAFTGNAQGGAALSGLPTLGAKPLAYTSVGGHFRVIARTVLLPNQAAGSRLFMFLNFGSNLLVIERYKIIWFPTAAHTANIEDSLDTYMMSAGNVDNVNTQTPAAQELRRGAANMAAAPGNALIAALALAGNVAGTSGAPSFSKYGQVGSLPQFLPVALPSQVLPVVSDDEPPRVGGHPVILRQSEGIETENRVLLGAAAGSSIYFDLQWAELASF